jgi:hypothetical protein
MTNNKIVSIGVELEGGIDRNDLEKIRDKFSPTRHFEDKRDGSVHVYSKEVNDAEFTFWDRKVENVFDFIKFCYDNGFVTDSSCGLHVHVKFADMEKAVAMFSLPKPQNEFVKKFKEKFSDKPKYLNRTTNHYCKARYNENHVVAQLQNERARYHAVNLASFGKHGTIEFRILPRADTGREAVASIKWLLKTATGIVNTTHMKSVVTGKVEGFTSVDAWRLPSDMTIEIHKLSAEGIKNV